MRWILDTGPLSSEQKINAAVFRTILEERISDLRREAEQALGPKFDQRKFHDAILALGAVPLPVLEQRMAQFIADGGENPPTPSRDPADHSN